MGQALGQSLARRLAQPLSTRDVAERGEDIADRAPRVHAAKELHSLLEVHPGRPGRSVSGDEEAHGVDPEEAVVIVCGQLSQPGQALEQRLASIREGAAGLGEHADGVQHRRRYLAIAELLGQGAALGVEALGAVAATHHVLVDPDLVERVGDGAPVAQPSEDRDPLGAQLAQPARPPQADLEPARRAQRLRAELGGPGPPRAPR